MPTELNPERTSPSSDRTHVPEPPDGSEDRKPLPAIVWIALVVFFVLLAAAIAWGIYHRSNAEHALTQQTASSSAITVAITHPVSSKLSPEVVLPGNVQAFTDTPIYSRSTGYLRHWYFDIGAHVRKGQLLATIETPELNQQLQQAQANLESAQADENLAQTTAQRYQNLLKSDSVSKQETDQATSNATAKQAAVNASEANVRRLQQMVSFQNIYAPFSGTITARNTDIGQLVDAGASGTSGASGSAAKELFHLANIQTVRVYVAVPEAYSSDVSNGTHAYLTLDEYPGRRFEGTIARNSHAIDPASRTLNVEVDVPNPSGELLPGAYVFVHFRVPDVHTETFTIPSNTLLFRSEGLRVGVVRDGRIHLQPVTIRHDAGATVEVSSGLNASDEIVLDPSDSLSEGQKVQVANTSPKPSRGNAAQ